MKISKAKYNWLVAQYNYRKNKEQLIEISDEEYQRLIGETFPHTPTGEQDPPQEQDSRFNGRFVFDLSKHQNSAIKIACTQPGIWCKILVEKIDDIYHIKCYTNTDINEDLVITTVSEICNLMEGTEIIVGTSNWGELKCYSGIGERIGSDISPTYNKNLDNGIGYLRIKGAYSNENDILQVFEFPIITKEQSYLFHTWYGMIDNKYVKISFGELKITSTAPLYIGNLNITEYIFDENSATNTTTIDFNGTYYIDKNGDICLSYNNENIKISNYNLDDKNFQGTLIKNENNYSFNLTKDYYDLFFNLVTNKEYELMYPNKRINFDYCKIYPSASHIYTENNYMKLGNYGIKEFSFWNNNELCLTLINIQTGDIIIDEHAKYSYDKTTKFFSIISDVAQYGISVYISNVNYYEYYSIYFHRADLAYTENQYETWGDCDYRANYKNE